MGRPRLLATLFVLSIASGCGPNGAAPGNDIDSFEVVVDGVLLDPAGAPLKSWKVSVGIFAVFTNGSIEETAGSMDGPVTTDTNGRFGGTRRVRASTRGLSRYSIEVATDKTCHWSFPGLPGGADLTHVDGTWRRTVTLEARLPSTACLFQ